MTIHQLQSFLAVAEKQSFTAAADILYISQSALSQQIRQLEHQLGFQLFDRSTRQVTLTEAGRSFYRNAQQLQALYAHALSEGQQLQQLSSCHFKHFCIGCLGDQFFQLWGICSALPCRRQSSTHPGLSAMRARRHFTLPCCGGRPRSPPCWKTRISTASG